MANRLLIFWLETIAADVPADVLLGLVATCRSFKLACETLAGEARLARTSYRHRHLAPAPRYLVLTQLAVLERFLSTRRSSPTALTVRNGTTAAAFSRCSLLGPAKTALARAVAENVVPGLSTVTIDGSYVGDAGGLEFAAALRTTSVTSLSLTANDIGNEGAVAIAAALETNTLLRVLDLSDNNLRARAAASFARMLSVNSTLRALHLSQNPFGGAPRLLDAAGSCRLSALSLAVTGIADVGAAKIAAALRVTSSLEWLNVSGNNITNHGALEIAKALAENTTLRHLALQGNVLTMRGGRALAAARTRHNELYSDARPPITIDVLDSSRHRLRAKKTSRL
ncbi:hypothetical protein CTAYLR_009709 [Chrysophaeum taylorii]|uniref:Uncharacterized protein n=1 Tax=Chrysophaeum taylorii TaxID=2483200 RepID=A0AAD7UH41_9STRA|nr:hypothetical protein CTAYLR_009709 [Chrysophaeum taylorii]